MLETMQQDYVRTAKAKGLRYRRVIGLHVLRNSLIPAVTATAPLLGLIITGHVRDRVHLLDPRDWPVLHQLGLEP